MRRLLPILAAMLLAGCVPGPPTPATQYRRAEYIPLLPLWFAPDGTRLSAQTVAQLQALATRLPVDDVPDLYAAGPLASARADTVGDHLGRPVRLLYATGLAPGQTTLVVHMPSGIIADACRGNGKRALGTLWPANDSVAPLLLPPGCVTAAAIQAQVTYSGDLLYGRPLPPAAASPYAAAIERYYHRNDAPQQQSTGASGSDVGAGTQAQAGAARAGPAAGQGDTSSANPLLGGLPQQQQAPAH